MREGAAIDVDNRSQPGLFCRRECGFSRIEARFDRRDTRGQIIGFAFEDYTDLYKDGPLEENPTFQYPIKYRASKQEVRSGYAVDEEGYRWPFGRFDVQSLADKYREVVLSQGEE